MTKLESLQKLKTIITEAPDTIAGKYCIGDQCCVIGHLLKINGITNEQLKELDKGKYSNYSYGIGSIISISLGGEVENDFIKAALEGLGFNLQEDKKMLNDLQKLNDDLGKVALLTELDEIIAELEIAK